jgi:hypothetical protein
MAEPRWLVLRQRLLEGGVSPRRIRRLLGELHAHYRELLAEERESGADAAAAGRIAPLLLFALLGAVTNLDVRVRSVSAGLGFRTDALAALLLHRWPPTALGAAALAALLVWAARALRRHKEAHPGHGLS